MNNLSIDGEFRYIVTWFNEFSELQREDFVPILVDLLTAQDVPGNVYMNGVVNSVSNAAINERPMSLFQCRIKLFREWTPKWTVELRHKLKEKIMELDTKVGEKIINEIKCPNSAFIYSNGDCNGDSVTENDVMADITVASESAASAEVPHIDDAGNETSVDANDTDDTTVAAAQSLPTASVELAEQVEHVATTMTITATVSTNSATVTPTLTNASEVPLLA